LAASPLYSQVAVSWNPPASDGGAVIEGYRLYAGTTSGGESDTPVNGSFITGTSFTVGHLTGCATYYFKVAAVNSAGEGPMSGEVSAVALPSTHYIFPEPPTGVSATPGHAQVIVSWSAAVSRSCLGIGGYNLYQGTSSGQELKTPVNDSLIKGTSYTATGLSDGTTYYFVVMAVNDAGLSSRPSDEVSATPAVTGPGPPTGLTAAPGNSRVTLSWAAPTSDGGSPVTRYNVYEGTTPGFKDGAAVTSAAGTTATVSGLTNGITYYFRVAAVNAVGEGLVSDEASAVPVSGGSTTTSAPAAPTGLIAKAGNSQVSLKWTAPASDGGSPVTGYDVYDGISPGFPSKTAVISITGTSVTVNGLTNGTTYYFRVTAVNAAGKISRSSTEASATPAGSPPPPVAPGPKPLTILLTAIAVVAAAGVITLAARRWLRPHPPAPSVQAMPKAGQPRLVSARNTGPDVTHTIGLEPNPGTTATTIKEAGS
jgi:fibronectin type 3 domain-containing protein